MLFIEHHGCPNSLFVFCSTLSGTVESNNCVSCSVIMRSSLFLSGLYWNLDPVPLQWLSPSISVELMVSPSPCEFPPLQRNYPFSPRCAPSQLSIFPLYLPVLSFLHHYIFSILFSLSYSPTCSFLSSVTIHSCLLSVHLSHCLLSYPSRTRYPKDASMSLARKHQSVTC